MSVDFDATLAEHGLGLSRGRPEILQLNVGKLCNLTCVHCHVNAGPNRLEIITGTTVDRVLEWFEASPLDTLDLTGGTPEMVPDFRRLVTTVRRGLEPRTCSKRESSQRISASASSDRALAMRSGRSPGTKRSERNLTRGSDAAKRCAGIDIRFRRAG